MSGDVMGVKEISSRYRRGVLGPELPAGYKKTDIGVIPEDWIPLSIKDFSSVKTGPFGTLLKASEYSEGDGVPLISVGEIGIGKFRISEHTPLVSKIVTNRLPQYLLKKGDIVFGRKGAVDRSALVTDREAGWFLGSDGISIRPDQRNEPAYLAYQFQRHDVQQWLLQNAAGTTMASLNQAVLGRVRIPCPPKHEQRAIATALSNVDALLEELDRLIAKKRDLKQATMQQLLTGQTRLPGFKGEWKRIQIGDIGRTYGGLTGKSKSDFGTGSGLFVPFTNVMENTQVDCQKLEKVRVTERETQNRVMKGDVLFNGSSETPEEVAMCALMTEDIPHLYLNSFCFGFRIGNRNDVNSLYFVYFIRSHEGRKLIQSLAQGSTRYNISKTALLEAEIALPDMEEQAAISQAIKDMETDILILEERRNKTSALKQAMMQELLTGRTRLA